MPTNKNPDSQNNASLKQPNPVSGQPSVQVAPPKKSNNILFIILIAVGLIFSGTVGYFYYQYKTNKNSLNNNFTIPFTGNNNDDADLIDPSDPDGLNDGDDIETIEEELSEIDIDPSDPDFDEIMRELSEPE